MSTASSILASIPLPNLAASMASATEGKAPSVASRASAARASVGSLVGVSNPLAVATVARLEPTVDAS